MDTGFWSFLATIAIFFTSFMVWRNNQQLKNLEQEIKVLNTLFKQNDNNDIPLTSSSTHRAEETVEDEPPISYDYETLFGAKTNSDINKKTNIFKQNNTSINKPSNTNIKTIQKTGDENKQKEKVANLAWGNKIIKVDETSSTLNETTPNEKPSQEKTDKIPKENLWEKYSAFEFNLGAKLPVWLGAIALIISGFFFVKYSIENNLIPPFIRLIILFIIGTAMIIGAELIHRKPKIANGRRISQALTGVGFAVIYGVFYAASQVWQYIPVPIAFAGMVVTTFLALYYSIKYGVAIAYLALISAYITPVLMNSKESSTLFLFAYILCIFAAISFVAKHQKWWNILFAILIANFLWVSYWVALIAMPSEAIWLYIFLIAQSGLIIWSSEPLVKLITSEATNDSLQYFGFMGILNLISHVGGMLFLVVIMQMGKISGLDWLIFDLIAILTITLSLYGNKNYSLMPVAAAVLALILMFSEQDIGASTFTIQVVAATIAWLGFGFYKTVKSNDSRLWALFTSLATLSYFVGYYIRLTFDLNTFEALFTYPDSNNIAICAGLLSAIFGLAYIKIAPLSAANVVNNVKANFAATSTAFLSIAIAIFIDKSAWPIAFGLQMVALSYIDSKLKNQTIRVLTIVLAVIIMLILIPNLVEILDYMLILTFDYEIFGPATWDITFLNSPILFLGIPTACFGAAAYFMRKHLDDITVKIMETIALTLFTLSGYLIIRYAFNGDAHVFDFDQSMFETGVITSFIFIVGILSFMMTNYTGRKGYDIRGWVNVGMAFGRIIIFDMIMHNPLFDYSGIKGVLIFNPLIFSYAMPLVWVALISHIIQSKKYDRLLKVLTIFTSILGFVFINLNIRFMFQDYIHIDEATSVAELYTYSLVWLSFGILLLALAIWKQKKWLRYASQVIVMLTVTKVFLIDAANLEGLYRIASFAMLGVCLIVISSVYSKYILNEQSAENLKQAK